MQTSMQRKLDKNDGGIHYRIIRNRFFFRNTFRWWRQRQVDAKVNFGSFFV